MLLLPVLLVVIAGANAAGWSYSRIDEWPELCHVGKRQSPVALFQRLSRKSSIPPLDFDNYDVDYRASLENNGHTVEIRTLNRNTRKRPTLSGGNLKGTYILENIHFHWFSEHIIDGRRYPLEAHLVHFKREYGNATNAGNYEDGIVVLGVMFQASLRENEDLDNIAEAAEEVSRNVGVPTEIRKGIEVADLLPEDTEHYYSYDGSLTTPGCNEAVTWIVFEGPLTISRDQYKTLSNIDTEEGEQLENNFRPLQDLNGRQILYA